MAKSRDRDTRFSRALGRVLLVQAAALALLWWLQSAFHR